MKILFRLRFLNAQPMFKSGGNVEKLFHSAFKCRYPIGRLYYEFIAAGC